MALWGWSWWWGPYKDEHSKSFGTAVLMFAGVQAVVSVAWLLAVNRSKTRLMRRWSWAAALLSALNAIAMTAALHWWDDQRSQAALRAPPRWQNQFGKEIRSEED
jgi:hypothetical protein